MRWLRVVGFDAFQLQRLHGGGLSLDFFFQPLQQFALLDDDRIQLLDLVFKVGQVCLQLVHAPGIFVCHETNLPGPPPEVEAANEAKNDAQAAKLAKGRHRLAAPPRGRRMACPQTETIFAGSGWNILIFGQRS